MNFFYQQIFLSFEVCLLNWWHFTNTLNAHWAGMGLDSPLLASKWMLIVLDLVLKITTESEDVNFNIVNYMVSDFAFFFLLLFITTSSFHLLSNVLWWALRIPVLWVCRKREDYQPTVCYVTLIIVKDSILLRVNVLNSLQLYFFFFSVEYMFLSVYSVFSMPLNHRNIKTQLAGVSYSRIYRKESSFFSLRLHGTLRGILH